MSNISVMKFTPDVNYHLKKSTHTNNLPKLWVKYWYETVNKTMNTLTEMYSFFPNSHFW